MRESLRERLINQVYEAIKASLSEEEIQQWISRETKPLSKALVALEQVSAAYIKNEGIIIEQLLGEIRRSHALIRDMRVFIDGTFPGQDEPVQEQEIRNKLLERAAQTTGEDKK
jgi:hypothetical protein